METLVEQVDLQKLKSLLERIVLEIVNEMEKPHYHSSGFPHKTELKEKLISIIEDESLSVDSNQY